MRTQIATNVSLTTRRQADELVKHCGYSMRDVVTIAIRMLYQDEFDMSTYYDVDYHSNHVSAGDVVRLIKIQHSYTSTPHWSGDDGPKAGEIRISYSFVVSDEPREDRPSFQGDNLVEQSWDNGGFVVTKAERIDYDTLRVWVRKSNS